MAGDDRKVAAPPVVKNLDTSSLAQEIDRSWRARGVHGFALETRAGDVDGDVRRASACLRSAFGEALATVVKSGSRVCIFGDYDCDGICASSSAFLAILKARAFLARWKVPGESLIKVAEEVGLTVRVPERRDGYGLQVASVEKLAARGVEVIVACDNGTNALLALERAEALGVRVLVIDHHPLSPEASVFWSKPGPRMLCNPMFGGEIAELLLASATGREICASFLVDLVVAELYGRLGIGDGHDVGRVLAGIATVTDVMPLMGANRSIVRNALSDLGDALGPPGLVRMTSDYLVKSRVLDQSTMQYRGLAGSLDAEMFGFFLGPRLNACGRMGRASLGLELALARGADADELVPVVEAANDERRAIQKKILASVDPLVEDVKCLGSLFWELTGDRANLVRHVSSRVAVRGLSDQTAFLAYVPGVAAVVCSEEGDEGCAGLVAGILAAKLGCPVLFCAMRLDPTGQGHKMIVGSGRVPPASPLLSISTGAVASRVFAAIGGNAGGHSAAFGVRARLPGEPSRFAACIRVLAERFSVALVETFMLLGDDRIAELRGDGIGEVAAAELQCDISLSIEQVTADVCRAIADFGPYGHGFPAPKVRVELPVTAMKRMGSGESFNLDVGVQNQSARLICFESNFPGGISKLEADGLGRRLVEEGCSVVGKLRQSFFGYQRRGAGWSGPRPEMIVEAVVARSGRTPVEAD